MILVISWKDVKFCVPLRRRSGGTGTKGKWGQRGN